MIYSMKVRIIDDEINRVKIIKIKGMTIKDRVKLALFGKIKIPYWMLR